MSIEISKCSKCNHTLDNKAKKCKCGHIVKKNVKTPLDYSNYWIFLIGHLMCFGLAIWFFIDLRMKEGVVAFPYDTIIGFTPISIAMYYYFRYVMYGALKNVNIIKFVSVEIFVLAILKSIIILLLSKYYDFF